MVEEEIGGLENAKSKVHAKTNYQFSPPIAHHLHVSFALPD